MSREYWAYVAVGWVGVVVPVVDCIVNVSVVDVDIGEVDVNGCYSAIVLLRLVDQVVQL